LGRKWTRIFKKYMAHFKPHRTPVHLKDRYRFYEKPENKYLIDNFDFSIFDVKKEASEQI
jgi:hypothetical protein